METREAKNSQIRKEIVKEEREKRMRKFAKITSTILIICLLILGYGIFIGAKWIDVLEYKVTSSNLPSSFHGLKVLQISDILYDSFNKSDLKRLEKKVNEVNADVIVFTGNIKDEDTSLSQDELKTLKNFFKNIKANLAKYAVRGIKDDTSFDVIMENTNFKILDNDFDILYNQDLEPLQFIGFDSNNLAEVKVKDTYAICLLNNPDKIKEIIANTPCNLALAGDTLGGEIKMPFLEEGLFNEHKYYKNYYLVNNTKLFISNGLGNTLNMRLFNHPSISLYRLTKY